MSLVGLFGYLKTIPRMWARISHLHLKRSPRTSVTHENKFASERRLRLTDFLYGSRQRISHKQQSYSSEHWLTDHKPSRGFNSPSKGIVSPWFFWRYNEVKEVAFLWNGNIRNFWVSDVDQCRCIYCCFYRKKRKWLDRFSDFRFFTVVRNLAVCSSRNSNLQK